MELPADLESKLRTAQPGEIVDMGSYPMAELPLLEYEKRAGGPQFVFSDDPEYFRVPEGAGVREKVQPGRVRLYTYHVNGTTESARRISTVIENLGSGPLTLRWHRYAFRGPSTDYYRVGKGGLVDFFSAKNLPPAMTIPAGGAAPLDPKMDAVAVRYDELVHGFYEFEIDQPARITTLQTSLETPAVEANARIREVLPPRKTLGAGRGLFKTSDYDITPKGGGTYDTSEGPKQILVADGKHDPWITGWDDSRSTGSRNAGNYGVLYRIRVPYRSSDGRGIAVVLWYPPAGGKWCDACALAVVANAGVHAGGVIEIPRDRTTFTGRTNAGVIQIYPPANQGTEGVIELTYSPPGASCLPNPILLIPIHLNEPKKE
ncbi:MAG: copper amine oxidase [Candidatus Hydrogenedentota bacterium]|nr:MAG: copper amine oxidase [Candidatus Hydrogenedentota bacterium]